MEEAKKISECLLIKPFVKEQLASLNLTFVGSLKFSCFDEQTLKSVWLVNKHKLASKNDPAAYFFKLCLNHAATTATPYNQKQCDTLLANYKVNPTDPFSHKKPSHQEQSPKRPQETKIEIRVLDIEVEYFKFERSKANNEVHPWALEAYGISWNPFAACFIELFKEGKTTDRPMAYHTDIPTPYMITPLELMVDAAKVL